MASAPRQTLVGEIDLTTRFRSLRSAIKEREVVLFWSDQFDPIDGSPFPRLGGWLVIPKAGRRQRHEP
jgi:hypothetical protein